MRILFICRNDFVYKDGSNPYVSRLVEGLRVFGHDVVCSLDEFWLSYQNYDLLFFQWPEEIFIWNSQKIDLVRLSEHFDEIKDSDVKTIVTCHNLHPHNHDNLTERLYDLVYSHVDVFHHLGGYSYRLLKEKYPQKHHFIAPHHVPDDLWNSGINTTNAKHVLHIPENRIVISSFGAFRNVDEEKLFITMVKGCKSKDVCFMAPRIIKGKLYNGRWINRSFCYVLKCLILKMLGIRFSGFLSEEELSLWLSASDIVFIQRKEILNSGNVPLAFSAGKIVVGPDVGNVGEILKETDNYVFDPQSEASIRESVLGAIDSVKSGKCLGNRNIVYAKNNWTTARVCSIINDHISLICQA